MISPIDIIKKIKRLEITTSRNTSEIFAGNFKSSFKGQGLEIDDIRLYDDGDDARSIDWITSAKQGVTYVKKYRETRETSILILADLSASMNFGSAEKTKKEVAMELAAILLFSAQKNGDKFGALLLSDKVGYVPPRKGKSQLFRILKEMHLGFDRNLGFEPNLEQALKLLNTAVKRRVVCFLISDSLPESSSASLGIANKKHDFVFINVYDRFERGEFGEGILRMKDPETGEEAVFDLSKKELRENYLKIISEKMAKEAGILKKNKINSLSISTEDNIHDELSLFFKKRQRRV